MVVKKKHYIPSLLKLNKTLEREGIHVENDIAIVLKYANDQIFKSIVKVFKIKFRT